jgi:Zn-dependent protease
VIANLSATWVLLPGFILGLTVHEFAHAASAAALGDRFAASDGRLTLNPLAHLSPVGTLSILFLGFGWARPVPVNIYNFRNPRRDFLLTSLAGPASNVVLMLLLVASLRLIFPDSRTYILTAMANPDVVRTTLFEILFLGAYANAILAILNLLPIPPLDGSRIWPFLFPKVRLQSGKFSWIPVVMLLAAVWAGALGWLFDFAFQTVGLLAGLQ